MAKWTTTRRCSECERLERELAAASEEIARLRERHQDWMQEAVKRGNSLDVVREELSKAMEMIAVLRAASIAAAECLRGQAFVETDSWARCPDIITLTPADFKEDAK